MTQILCRFVRHLMRSVPEKYHYGPLFSPPSLGKPTILMPGVAGGASWAGAGCDPETGLLYVPSLTFPFAFGVVKSPYPHADYIGGPGPIELVQGLPLYKPPYGRITAIDLNTGDHRWQIPLGDLPRSPPRSNRSTCLAWDGRHAVTCS